MLSNFNIFWRRPSCKILLYHRVANVKDDPYLLSVSVDNFKRQISWLRNNINTIPLLELVHQIKSREFKSNCACITFDDGYVDNFYNALPILKQFHVPATIFITSGLIGKKTPFYWDINTQKDDQGRALNKIELIKLAREESLIEIGSHTITHPRLVALSIMDQEKEIIQSKSDLENILHKKVLGFSYPFGTKKDFCKEAVEIVKTAGYSYACANFSGNVDKFSNPYLFSRVIIRNWPIEVFMKKMKRIL